MINVLIVENDPMVLEINKSFLERLPLFRYKGSTKTGKEALDLIKSESIDLVLLEIYLPDVSGIELLHEIRKLNIPTDVIVITSIRDTETVHQLFRLGTVDYLIKPFQFERFKTALENYRKMWSKLQGAHDVSQEDIDDWKVQKGKINTDSLPKGLSSTTLKQIVVALHEQNDPITAEQLSIYLGMARVTVRRYLEYLEKKNRIQISMKYGRVGRPTHFYFM